MEPTTPQPATKQPDEPVIVDCAGLKFTVPPKVFSPVKDKSSFFFAERMAQQNISGYMIEVGAGVGIVGLSTLAQRNMRGLTATDINPHAVEATLANSRNNGLADRVTAHVGNVYDALPSDHRRVDAIFWNAPWIRVRPGRTNKTWIEHSFYDPDYRGVRSYIEGATRLLKPEGRLFLGFGKGGNVDAMTQIASANKFEVVELAARHDETGDTKLNVFYELQRPAGNIFPAYPTNAK